MKSLGLTGGVGMGKSTAAELLRQRGHAVVDTDQIARDLVEPGQPALAEITAAFGRELLGADGCLRRDKLAEKVFADTAARRQLEAILHPRIREVWQAQLRAWEAEGRALGVVVIPLLFETQAQASFTATVCVACTAATQQQRLAARGWTAEQIRQRIKAQMPVEKKIAQSDFLLWTEGGLDVHAEQLDRILRQLES
ncbi:MAG: dephospho-CoA kinase [Verrucomicrobia bacterium]|nr:dephospho-CoA kinase [Verrucomicrobiota bacterium]